MGGGGDGSRTACVLPCRHRACAWRGRQASALAPAAVLLLALALATPAAAVILSNRERQSAFIGYQEAGELDPHCLNTDTRCLGWAARGECVKNPR